MISFPQFFRVRQKFERIRIADVPREVHAQLAQLPLADRVKPGQSVAIAAGSRGITNLAAIVKASVEHLKSLGAQPFVVPAMGSHGGATAEGQRQLLETYGLSEAQCGCPIRSSMETVIVGRAAEGFPLYFDRHAFNADHVLVINRVKPHTDFAGDIESGLMKMLLIGLGKHDGAKIYHRAIHDYSFGQIVRSAGEQLLKQCRILAGLAIVENAYDETAQITAVLPQQFIEREIELLALAKRWMARLPFQHVDLLMIDEIGKNISGTGMDTNVVGRKVDVHKAQPGEWPKVRRIYVRSLTPESKGNATGIGCAEFCHQRVVEATSIEATRINCLTSGRISVGMMPFDFPTDHAALTAALPTVGLVEPENAKLLWIKNTLDLEELECSTAYLEEARTRADLEVLSEPRDLPFDAHGNLSAVSGTALAAGESPSA